MVTKIQSKDIKDKAFLTTGTSPDYEVNIARETSYADMDRQKFTVNFHAAGTGVITLNINGLGIKSTGLTDVDIDSYYEFIYDLSQDVFVSSEVGGNAVLSGYNAIINTGEVDPSFLLYEDTTEYEIIGTGTLVAYSKVIDYTGKLYVSIGAKANFRFWNDAAAPTVRQYVNVNGVNTSVSVLLDWDSNNSPHEKYAEGEITVNAGDLVEFVIQGCSHSGDTSNATSLYMRMYGLVLNTKGSL